MLIENKINYGNPEILLQELKKLEEENKEILDKKLYYKFFFDSSKIQINLLKSLNIENEIKY